MDDTSKFKRQNYERLRTAAISDKLVFPSEKLKQSSSAKQKIVFIACGSFSPITYMHLRMFEQAKDFANSQGFEVVGAYISPVTDAYKKKGLVEAKHRVAMCKLAVESSDWIDVEPWESEQDEYQTTLVVLDHFDHFINKNRKETDKIHIKLLCGGDLLDSFNTPGVWAPEDIEDILTKYGVYVLERAGTDASGVVWNNDVLYKHRKDICIIKQWIANDISSTKIRQNIARDISIRYLTPDPVVNYIKANHLYSNVKL